MEDSTHTLFKALLLDRSWNKYPRFREEYIRAAGGVERTCPSESTFWRWCRSERPPANTECHPVLEAMFAGRSVRDLFAPAPVAAATPDDQTDAGDPLGSDYQDLNQSIGTVTSLWDQDMRRRDFLQGATTSALAFLSPAFDFLVQPPDASAARTGARHAVTMDDVQLIRTVSGQARMVDSTFGGARYRTALLGFLEGEVADMLNGTYTDAVGRELYAATAEATYLLGWMAHDIGRHGLAQRYYTHALRFAQASGDTTQGVDILSFMGYVARDARNYSEAVRLTRAGVEKGRGTVPAMRAHLHGFEAWALTAVGDKRGVVKAIDEAARCFDQASPTDPKPGSAAEVNRGDLYGLFGHCYTTLGMTERGEEVVTEALAELASPRSRSFVLLHAGNLAVQRRDAEQAVRFGTETLNMMPKLTSSRVGEEMTSFVQNLNALGDTRVVREFTERVRVEAALAC